MHTLYNYSDGTCIESLCRQASRFLSQSLPGRFSFIQYIRSINPNRPNPQSAEVLLTPISQFLLGLIEPTPGHQSKYLISLWGTDIVASSSFHFV
jgi:hypothetical protein